MHPRQAGGSHRPVSAAAAPGGGESSGASQETRPSRPSLPRAASGSRGSSISFVIVAATVPLLGHLRVWVRLMRFATLQ